jgi:predicted protein tyrosine phosphatase
VGWAIVDEIAKFVIKWYGKVSILLVQCDAGQSRSAGLAAAILQFEVGDDSQIFENYHYTPNMFCRRSLLKALQFRESTD